MTDLSADRPELVETGSTEPASGEPATVEQDELADAESGPLGTGEADPADEDVSAVRPDEGSVSDDVGPGDAVPDDEPDGEPPRVTEIGAPEIIDKEVHPVAAAVGVAVLLLVVLAGVLGINRVFGGSEDRSEVAEVVVPRLSNRTVTEAQAELERLGLIVDVRFQPNEVIPPDVVVEQEPIAGARLEIGEQVTLGVSDGPAGVRVPDLVGQTRNEASRLVSVLGLTPAVVDAYDEEVLPGIVISTNPAAKGRGVIGSPIELKVSKGPAPRTVPAVVGLTSPEAMVQIGDSDLTVGDVTRRYEAGKEPGTVLVTNPAPGAKVARGLPIDVVIASAQPTQTVPDLVGLTRASAQAVAKQSGITLKVTTELVVAGDRRAGLVISQTPVADSPVAAMSVVVGVLPTPSTTTTTPGGTTTSVPGRATTTTRP